MMSILLFGFLSKGLDVRDGALVEYLDWAEVDLLSSTFS
jgi:hypothetical protein